MLKRERDILKAVEANGLKVLEAGVAGRGNYRLELQAPNGQTSTFVFMKTPDGGTERRENVALRKFAESNTPKTTVMASALREAGVAVMPARPEPVSAPTLPVEPAQPEERAMDMKVDQPVRAKKTSAINKVSQTEFYRLCEWLKSQPLEDREVTQVQLAIEATKALQVTIVDSTVGTALKATGIVLKAPKTQKEKLDRTRIIARELERLMLALGQTPSPELVAIARA